MKTAHTPGPWSPSEISGKNIKEVRIYSSAQFSQVASVNMIGMENNSQKLADIALISAAPDLLAALEQLVSRIDQWSLDNPGNDGMYHAMTIEARAAIQKATSL